MPDVFSPPRGQPAATPNIKITVLGSGTSAGIPTLTCDCAVCTSTDPRDNRLRPSVLIEYNGRKVLIDTTPDFRQQALRHNIRSLDAILYTHAHADHIMCLDDVRPYNFHRADAIPIYASPDTLERIQFAVQPLAGNSLFAEVRGKIFRQPFSERCHQDAFLHFGPFSNLFQEMRHLAA